MILPEKHISLSESILGLGGFLLSYIDKPVTVDELWIKFNQSVKDKEYPKYHSFDNLILALDFLFLLESLQLDQKGRLIRAID